MNHRSPSAPLWPTSNPCTLRAGPIYSTLCEGVESPSELVDVHSLLLTQMKTSGVGISIGALAKNSDTANHPIVRQDYPLLTQAILAAASPQIRNMATNGGNLLQRTRCPYFYDISQPCNKREPGTGCSAMEGINRNHAIFGWSETCVAVHPSDMCVALAALDAQVRVQGSDGKDRLIPFADFHRLPGNTPEKDTNLQHGELITAIEIPKNNFAANSYYLKVRDRASYAFALFRLPSPSTLRAARSKLRGSRWAVLPTNPGEQIAAEKALTGEAPN